MFIPIETLSVDTLLILTVQIKGRTWVLEKLNNCWDHTGNEGWCQNSDLVLLGSPNTSLHSTQNNWLWLQLLILFLKTVSHKTGTLNCFLFPKVLTTQCSKTLEKTRKKRHCYPIGAALVVHGPFCERGTWGQSHTLKWKGGNGCAGPRPVEILAAVTAQQFVWCYTKTSTTFHLQATLKRYQTEHRNKLDSLEKSQAELKKIRRKSQGGRNALKYEHKEIEVNFSALLSLFCCWWFVQFTGKLTYLTQHILSSAHCSAAVEAYEHFWVGMSLRPQFSRVEDN